MDSSGGSGGGDSSQHTSAIETAIRQIEEYGDECVANFDVLLGIVAAIDTSAGVLGDAVLWAVRDDLDTVKEKIDEVMDIAAEVLAHHTPVISLINISFHWLEAVKQPVSGMVPTIQQYATENLAYWEGTTANHYKQQILPPQVGAATELSNKASFISDWLYGIAQDNVEYSTGMATLLSDLAGKLAAAILKAGSIIDIPFTISDLADVVGALVQVALENLLTIVERITQAGENVRQIVSDHVDESKFPGGQWPQAVQG